MNNSKLFLSLWSHPRKTINFLFTKNNSYIFLKISLFLTFFYSVIYLSFLWISDLRWIMTKIIDNSHYYEIISLFIFFLSYFTIILNLSSLVFYYLIQLAGGLGNFLHTKLAVFWSCMTTIPSGLAFVLFIWSGEANLQAVKQGFDYPLSTACLQCTAALGFVFFSIYSLIILSKMLSEIHKIPSGRSFVVVLTGVSATCILGQWILKTVINIFG